MKLKLSEVLQMICEVTGEMVNGFIRVESTICDSLLEIIFKQLSFCSKFSKRNKDFRDLHGMC